MSNVMNPDGTHKIIAGYSHSAGLAERDAEIAMLRQQVEALEQELELRRRIRELEADRDALGDELHDILVELVAAKAERDQALKLKSVPIREIDTE